MTRSIILVHGGFVDGLPHGMLSTHPDILNPDLLAFIRGEPLTAESEARSAIPLNA